LEVANADQAEPRNPGCRAVVELRQYTLKPGQRDVLMDLFDRHFGRFTRLKSCRQPGSIGNLKPAS
jgi:hypothetical protein